MSTGLAAIALTLANVLAPTQAATPEGTPGKPPHEGVDLQPDVPPRAIKLTRPKYPKPAFYARLEGTVEVEFLIDAKGNVAGTRLIKSVPGLDAAAIECVRSWRFHPAQKAGRAVATVARAPVTFRIYSKPK